MSYNICTAQTFQINQDTNHVFEGVLGLQLFPKWTVAPKSFQNLPQMNFQVFGRFWQKYMYMLSLFRKSTCGMPVEVAYQNKMGDIAWHTSITFSISQHLATSFKLKPIILSTLIHLDYIGNTYLQQLQSGTL